MATVITATRYNLVNGLPSVGNYVLVSTSEVVSREIATNSDGSLKIGYIQEGELQGVRKTYDNGDIEDVLVYKMYVNYTDKSILCYVKEFLISGRTGKITEMINLTGLYRNGMFVANEETWVSLIDGSFHSPRPTKTLWTNIATQEVVEIEPSELVDEFGVELYTISYENLPNFVTQYAYFDGVLGSQIRGFQSAEMVKRAEL